MQGDTMAMINSLFPFLLMAFIFYFCCGVRRKRSKSSVESCWRA